MRNKDKILKFLIIDNKLILKSTNGYCVVMIFGSSNNFNGMMFLIMLNLNIYLILNLKMKNNVNEVSIIINNITRL